MQGTMCYYHPLSRFRTHLHHGLLCQKILTHIYSSRCRWYSARNLLRVPVHLTVGHSINKHDQTPLLTHPLSFPPQQHHVLGQQVGGIHGCLHMVTRLYSCQTWLKNVTAVAANLWANTETRDLIWPLNIWTSELPGKIR